MQKMKFSNMLSVVFYIIAVLIPSQAAIFNTPCVDELTGTSNGCTAQDIAVQDIQIVWVGDGCTGPTDTALVRMNVTLATANPNRYDPGIYINTFGGTSAVTATGSQCLHEALYPLNNTTFDYTSGVGPFKDLDDDATGDMLGSETLIRSITQGDIGDANQSTLAEFQISCADNDDGLGNGPNGYVDFAWAVSYAQNANSIIGTSILDTVPGAKSKCTSGVSDTQGTAGSIAIGVPDLAVTISCEQKAGTSDTLVCTVVHQNNSLLGSGDYIEYHIDYNGTQADYNSTVSLTDNNSSDTPDTVNSSTDGTIIWKLDDGVAIAPEANGTFVFELIYDVNLLGDDINISVMGYYNNGSTLVAQTSLYDESIIDTSNGTLPVTIAYVYPEQIASTLDVSFSTATEVGNIGFNIYAIKGHKWTKLNNELIPGALDSFEPKDYQVSLDIAEDIKFKKIGVAGVDINGVEDRHGPFKIGHKSGSKAEVVKVDWKKVNKQVKANNKARKAAKKAARKATKVALKDQMINLSVSKDAVYRVTHDDLVDAGINLNGQKAENIAISFRGEGVARYIDGLNKKDKWTEESFIQFIGTAPEGSDALYLDANQYQLSLNKKLVVKSDSIKPITAKELVFEVNKGYGNLVPSDDPFYDGFFYAKGDKQGVLTRSIDLPKLDEETLDMIVYVSTLSDTNHHLIVSLNGIELANETSKGTKEWPINIKINKNVLNEGSNELTLTALGSSDEYDMYVYDKLVFSYDDGQENISESPTVTLTDKVKSRSIKPKKGTTYLIISHPLFMGDVLDGYIKQREGEGWNIQLVDVEEIYAAYGYGMATPDAIKKYLNLAERKGVTHVQLIGASSYDYHDYLSLGSVSFIPSIYVKTNSVNYTPSDSMYVSADTEMPKLAIGRWPVRTLEGLEAVINKSLNWKASGQSASHTALFVADVGEKGSNFAKQMDFIADKFETGKQWSDITRVYLDDFINQNNGDMSVAVTAAKDALIKSFSEGPSIVSYSGHSGPSYWSYEGILRQNDISSIQNIEKPSMVLPLACYTAYADSPSVNTMAHQLLAEDEDGAVAIYGSALLSNYSENGILTEKIIDNLFEGKTLGEAVLNAKNTLGVNYRDTILNGTLLGDVTLKLR